MEAVDPELSALAVEFVRAGDVVWDVGANVGLFTFSAAHLAGPKGQVVALEPDVWLVQLLRRSAAIQSAQSAQVRIVSAAVANSCDLREFSIARRSRAANFLTGYDSTQTGGVSEKQTTVCLTLDWLSHRLPIPGIVKIDVEGAEFEVLEGAVGLLESHHPIILCEVSSESSRKVTELLKDHRYQIYDAQVPCNHRHALDLAPWSTIATAA